ncbi:MAG: hypothetical protein ACLRK9_14580 [Roseburia hominis]
MVEALGIKKDGLNGFGQKVRDSMERLTERNPLWIDDELWERACEPDCEEIDAVYRKLKEYEDAEEQGFLLRLPYPLETEYIYFVDEKDMDVYELDAKKIEVSMMPISKKILYTVDYIEILFEDFGKIVFLTREEAEAKLKEMESSNE